MQGIYVQKDQVAQQGKSQGILITPNQFIISLALYPGIVFDLNNKE